MVRFLHFPLVGDSLKALPEPRPPLRTLQRRLQRLVHDDLRIKHRGRKDAYCRIAERF
jgi:hypothetical protein